MMNLHVMKSVVTRGVGRGLLIGRKYSPEILMFTGVVGIVGSTILACKATLKADEIIDGAKFKLDKIHHAKESATNGTVIVGDEVRQYTEEDYKKDITVTYIRTGWDFVKLYGPAVTLGVVSIGCMLGAHGIMRKRNLALVAAYKTVEESFAKYRKRVVEELGEEKDRQFKYGIKKEKITAIEVDENGKSKKVTKTIDVVDNVGPSQYARYFDENCKEWSPTTSYNLTYLLCQQQIANDYLQSRGHVFLNEVYDMLGIPRTPEGSVVGWVRGYGDDLIDFGLYDVNLDNRGIKSIDGDVAQERRDFVNGYTNKVLLDFNVDGVIWNLI